jgi:FixJ family two-component response regulator
MTDEFTLDSPIVYVVDDDDTLRASLGSLFRSVGLRVELFASPDEFSAFLLLDAPSCLVLDVRLQGQSGLTFQSELAKAKRPLPVVFMTGHGDIAMTVKAMKAGALDFLSKPFRDQDMLDAVANALEKDRAHRSGQKSLEALGARYKTLTPREREVLGYVVSGLMNKQIAGEMHLSEITVKIHRGQAMKKMAARSVADLVRKAEALSVPMPNHSSKGKN